MKRGVMDPVQVVASVVAGLITLAVALVATGVGLVYGAGHAMIAAGGLIVSLALIVGWLLLREDGPLS